ncbi:MAG: prepilin-type N-terminal cleavage/methylation domain-containing protein [Candidatus Omnitrophica bacterium]|nr:prepilin-type N-terminal cleavage/methylation domain-containing protein [Candidatus Omnitrophota bacterium]
MFKKIRGFTLIELMISLIIMSLIILGIYNIETFSNSQVIDSDRRARVQNDLTHILEHMSKNIQQANGTKFNPPIKLYPDSGAKTGFQVNFDCKSTPSNLGDDVWIYYTLNSITHELRVGCSGSNCGTGGLCSAVPPMVPGELLSDNIVGNFSSGALPEPLVNGFSVNIDALGNFVEIGLVGCYTTEPVGPRYVNPQVEMKTKVICNSSSTN